MEADGIGGGRRGEYTLNEPKIYDIATARSPERKKAGSVVIDRRKAQTKQTRRHNTTTVRQPDQNEAAGNRGDRCQEAYKAHLEQNIISPRFGGLHVVGQAGRMVVKGK